MLVDRPHPPSPLLLSPLPFPDIHKMASLTFIQYTPENRTNLPAKPWWTDSGRESIQTQPIFGTPDKSAWQNEPAGYNNHDMAQIVTGFRFDTNRAQGMYQIYSLSIHIFLIRGRPGHSGRYS